MLGETFVVSWIQISIDGMQGKYLNLCTIFLVLNMKTLFLHLPMWTSSYYNIVPPLKVFGERFVFTALEILKA